MKRLRTIDSFFKKRDDRHGDKLNSGIPSASNDNAPISTKQPHDSHQTSNTIEPQEKDFDDASLELERDPGKRIQIHKYPINQQDEVRRAYVKDGPYRPKLLEYPRSRFGSHYRRFQYSWFSQFSWLEYSPTTDKVYCFPCLLFRTGPASHPTLTVEGFNNWKRVNDGKNCIFLSHIGGPSSLHNTCVSRVEELMNPSQHVDKATIECVRWLTFQACPFKGHDESVGSKNRGNFSELVKHTAKFNDKVAVVVLENASKNAKYSSPMIQNEGLNILANIVRRKIREEVGDALGSIVNVITTSPKCHSQLQVAHTVNIEELVGAALGSIVNVITISPKCHSQLQVAHTVNIEELEIMGITDILCRELQNKSQDILNAMNLVTTTKDVLQKLRLDGWATFIDKVSLFCKKHDVDMSDMNAQYKVGTGHSCQQTDNITFEHHYHIDIFNNAIDFQLAELNSRFSEVAMELLILSSALEPREAFKAFNIDHICKLAEKFYPLDFT
ncbi:unnamed protein product [Malus baccata var. baccata]